MSKGFIESISATFPFLFDHFLRHILKADKPFLVFSDTPHKQTPPIINIMWHFFGERVSFSFNTRSLVFVDFLHCKIYNALAQ